MLAGRQKPGSSHWSQYEGGLSSSNSSKSQQITQNKVRLEQTSIATSEHFQIQQMPTEPHLDNILNANTDELSNAQFEDEIEPDPDYKEIYQNSKNKDQDHPQDQNWVYSQDLI